MSTLSPNMSLPVPSVGTTAGPEYANDINASLTLIDQHDHTPGYGVQITPAAININASLDFSDNFAINVSGVTLSTQGSTPGNSTIYESGTDLYYVDGLGNNVRITQSGGIAGSPGSIANLTSPASASYVSGSSTFVWESNTSIAAHMDFGSAIMRNLTPNSTYALTLQPPAALSANYTITLPSLPVSARVLSIGTSGTITAGATGVIVTADIAALAVTTAKIDSLAVTTAKIADEAVTFSKLATDAQFSLEPTTYTVTTTGILVPNGVRGAIIAGCGGGGGGGGGGGANNPGIGGGGCGGGGAPFGTKVIALTAGDSLNITIGSAGSGGAAGSPGSNGSAGSNGGNTVVTSDALGTLITFIGGKAGEQGLSNGTGGSQDTRLAGSPWGGAGGTGSASSNSSSTSGGDGGGNAFYNISSGGTGGSGVGAGGGGGGAGPFGAALGGGNGTSGAGGSASAATGSWGAGGGGGAGGRAGGAGGAGADGIRGAVMITWVVGE